MSFFPLALHRIATVWRLRWLLGSARPNPAYAPAPGRILYVAASCLPYHVSGYTSRTHELLCALKEGGADLRVITRTGYPWDRRDSLCLPEAEYTLRDGVRYVHARTPRNNRFTAIYAAQAATVLEHYARQEGVARIHAASNHVNALPALLAARRLGIPFQYEMRGLWELTRIARQPAFAQSHNFKLGLALEGFVASHADRVFVISAQLGRYAREHWGIPEGRLHLLPNCVDAGRICPTHLPEQPLTIGYAGSLINYEGLDTLLHALRQLRQSGMAARLEIAGHGEAREALEHLTTELGLDDAVRFYGRLSPEDARTRLSRCTLVCIPRRPFTVCEIVPPLKLAEAMALEKPVIVPDLPLFRDEAGEAGWFFRPGDAAHLAQVLAAAFGDPERCATMARKGRERIISCRQWRQFVPSVLGEAPCSAH